MEIGNQERGQDDKTVGMTIHGVQFAHDVLRRSSSASPYVRYAISAQVIRYSTSTCCTHAHLLLRVVRPAPRRACERAFERRVRLALALQSVDHEGRHHLRWRARMLV
eukprot:6173139-Pleurochrysis_carterae.AAC.2